MFAQQLLRRSSPSSLTRGVRSVVQQQHSTAAGTTTNTNAYSASRDPQLVVIPSQPHVGSMDPSFSGISPHIHLPLTFWPEMRHKFGDFYSFGWPGLGSPKTDHNTVYVLTDPYEAMKVVHAAGNHPSGFLETMWPTRNWMEEHLTAHSIFSRGPEWRRIRLFFQSDLLHPKAARGYLPGILQAARLASQGAKSSTEDLTAYLHRCSFDMFSSVMFGEFTQVANPTTPTDPDNETFITGAVTASSTSVGMVFDGQEYVQKHQHGITTPKGAQMIEAADAMWKVGQAKINRFLKDEQAGTLDDYQRNSYLARALERQRNPETNPDHVTPQEVLDISFVGFFAAVDTTSSVLGWNTLHLARNPHVQQKVYEEVIAAVAATSSATDGTDGKSNDGRLALTPACMDRLPYLNMVLRETQRITPVFGMVFLKEVGQDLVLHGTKVEQGEKVILEGYSTSNNPELVQDPDAFQPERWSPEAVKARKGTPSQVLDHPFLRDNFSQTARRCPGSRVARQEIQAMVAQLVLDWKFHVDDPTAPLAYHNLTAIEAVLPKIHFAPR